MTNFVHGTNRSYFNDAVSNDLVKDLVSPRIFPWFPPRINPWLRLSRSQACLSRTWCHHGEV